MFSAAIKTAAAAGGYQISRSLRFNSADSAYLARTFASTGNQKTWTWSGWLKLSAFGALSTFFERRSGASDATIMSLLIGDGSFGTTKDALVVARYSFYNLITTQLFRDPSAWYHIVLNVDTTQATSSNRMKLYVNGQQITAFSSSTYPSLNEDLPINAAAAHDIGKANYFNGYMTEINFIDGQALTPSSFGQTNGNTGVWEPVAYSGSYGTNGFYLNFSDNSNTTAATLGKDYSGNGNNWTPNNFSVSAGAGNDSLVDTPTPYGVDTGAGGNVRGNYATWNPIVAIASNGANSFSNGNLDWTTTGSEGSVEASMITTMPLPTTGKWYWEITPTSVASTAANRTQLGIMSQANINFSGAGSSNATNSFAYTAAGGSLSKVTANTYTSYGNSYAANDVIGVAVDLDNGAIYFAKNGTWQNSGDPTSGSAKTGAAYTGLTGASNYFPVVGYWGAFTANFGQRPFAYTAPSGFRALCTQNLPTPTIGATSTTQAGKYFNPVLYTGNDSARTITGVGFQPDFTWIKIRSAADNHYLFNAVTGKGTTYMKTLYSNATNAESPGNSTSLDVGVTDFASDGFTFGSGTLNGNQNGYTFVAWNWKANGAGSSNTAGSITSTVSANTTSGFSIVTWTGNGSSATIGHGLGVAPSMIITKFRGDISNWSVYHISTGALGRLKLNSTDAFATNAGSWNDTAPTSTVFSKGSGENDNGITQVAYCFAPIAGYSAFGSYTGNGSSDGPFVYCGFRPAYVLIKKTSATDEWFVWDSKRSAINQITGGYLIPNLSAAEGSVNAVMDLVSNGFKIRGTDTSWNLNGATFIFAAFAEFPQKFSLAR